MYKNYNMFQLTFLIDTGITFLKKVTSTIFNQLVETTPD